MTAHGVAQHDFVEPIPDQMPARDGIAEIEQLAIEERRAILDRVEHRVQIVFVQNHAHRLVEHFVHHAIAQ
jgi:hypothetical protein